MNSAVLTIQCADARGIVYNVARFIFERGGNLIDSQQYTEELESRFFMRVHFDGGDLDEIARELPAFADEHGMEAALSRSTQRKRMAIMVSKYDHCLYDLFLRHQYGEINADIALVVSNHPDLKEVAARFNVPYHHVPVVPGARGKAEQQVLDLCAAAGVDFVVLARYMQVLSPLLVDAYRRRIINVHHGFLPAFQGARPYHQAYEHGVKLIGASSHYVTEELDRGPIIEQETIRVNHTHRVSDLVALGRDLERKVLSNAVKAHAEERIMVYRQRTIVFD